MEGHGQQRGRCGHRLHHFRPDQGARDLAARHRASPDPGRGQGSLGAREQARAVLLSAQDDVWRWHHAADPPCAASLPLSHLHDLRLAAD